MTLASTDAGAPSQLTVNLHVLYSGLGGHGREFFTLAEASPAGTLAAVFYGVEPLLPEYAASCRRLNIPFRDIQKQPGADFGSWRDLYRVLREMQPGIVTLHGPTTIAAAAWYCRRHGAQLVVVETQANALKTRFERLTSRLAMRFADRVVCLNDESVRGLRAVCGRDFRASKVRVIPNAINLSRFAPAGDDARPGDAPRIGMQGRLVAIKDHPTLIRAFALLVERQGLSRAELHLAGGGEMEASLRALAATLNVADRVHFHGTLPEDDLIRFIKQLDVYVHATRGESFCFSIMEAFGCGLPVVASRVPVLDTTLAGLPFVTLVEAGDADALCAAIEPLARDPERRRAEGLAARAHAERELAPERMAERYDALHRELMA